MGVVAGMAAGGLLVWWLMRSMAVSQAEPLNRQIEELQEDNRELNEELDKARQQELTLVQEAATLRQALQDMKERQAENEKKLVLQFENLANRILENKSRTFTEQNEKNIHNLLQPLRERIERFAEKVEKSNKDHVAWNAALKQQIEELAKLNQRIDEEARNLTKALKGDTKAQGNWGEYILETILEKSGLRKGEEYVAQGSVTSEEGKRYQPDVVVKLPEGKHIIIDAKVALVAYDRFINAASDEERSRHLRDHVLAIRNHLKGLSKKEYQKLDGLEGLEFVLMFIPIEPAFSLAVQADRDIFTEALEQNIVIVSPSTLMATLRTIASIWKNERQNRYAIEIARQSGNLYDKFVGFTDDLLKVGRSMDAAKDVYTEAMNKLSRGRGNLVSRAEKIKELGAKASKSINQKLVDLAQEDYLPENSNNDDDNT